MATASRGTATAEAASESEGAGTAVAPAVPALVAAPVVAAAAEAATAESISISRCFQRSVLPAMQSAGSGSDSGEQEATQAPASRVAVAVVGLQVGWAAREAQQPSGRHSRQRTEKQRTAQPHGRTTEQQD
jgi:hypothetical protein